jgi:hypothetical protein
MGRHDTKTKRGKETKGEEERKHKERNKDRGEFSFKRLTI